MKIFLVILIILTILVVAFCIGVVIILYKESKKAPIIDDENFKIGCEK